MTSLALDKLKNALKVKCFHFPLLYVIFTERSVLGFRMGKSVLLKRVRLANQIQGFRF